VAGGGGLVLRVRHRRTEPGRGVRSLALSAAAALAAITLAIGIEGTVDRYLSGILLNQVTARAIDHVEVGVEPNLSPLDFQPPYTTDKLNDIDARVDVILARARQDGSGILRVNLFARDGTVLYSDLASLRGRMISPLTDGLVRGALAGLPGAALVSLDSPETDDLLADYGNAFQACAPVVINGEVLGVYELFQDPAPINGLRPPLWGTAAALAAAFFVLLRLAPTLLLRPRTAPAPNPRRLVESNLTRREIQVLDLLAQGCTYRSIGDRLVISEETVRTHVKSILHKFGEPNRAGAVAAAKRAGLLP
jgi:DNA-binding CsgD family transcriptional regulator